LFVYHLEVCNNYCSPFYCLFTFEFNINPMDLQLNNKVAIILAASKGLGKAIANTLSAEGARVIIGSRDKDELGKSATEIHRLTGNPVTAITVDVSESESIENFVAEAASVYGRIDILLNNAGGPPFDQFENFDEAAWRKAFELNLLSVAHISRLVLKVSALIFCINKIKQASKVLEIAIVLSI